MHEWMDDSKASNGQVQLACDCGLKSNTADTGPRGCSAMTWTEHVVNKSRPRRQSVILIIQSEYVCMAVEAASTLSLKLPIELALASAQCYKTVCEDCHPKLLDLAIARLHST